MAALDEKREALLAKWTKATFKTGAPEGDLKGYLEGCGFGVVARNVINGLLVLSPMKPKLTLEIKDGTRVVPRRRHRISTL